MRVRCALFGMGFLLGMLGLASSVGADTPDSKSGVSPSVLRLPKGPGSLEGVGENVKLSLNMGTMSYNIGFKIPAGRNGMTPTISLAYNSGSGSSCVGMGWSLGGIATIERMTARILPQYNNTDTFTSSGGGELVKVPGSPYYRARFEGSFVRYQWHQKDSQDQQGYWTAEHPDGSISYFGAASTDRSLTGKTVDRSSHIVGLQGTYKWFLQARIDTNGNRMAYSYIRDGGQLYLSSVKWVFGQSGSPLYEMLFRYQTKDRVDPTSDAKPGFPVWTRKLLEEVIIQSNGKRLRSYTLQYEAPAGLSRLKRVIRLGRDKTTPHPIVFSMTYTDPSKRSITPVTMPTGAGVNFKTGNIDFLDINGDGLPDLVDTSNSTHQFRLNQYTVDNKLQKKSHDFSALKSNPFPTSAKLSNPKVHFLDVDGDGFVDLLDAVNQTIHRSLGKGQWEANSVSMSQPPPTPGTNANARFFDYNGDKKIDVLVSDGSTTSYYVSDGKGRWTYKLGAQDIGASFKEGKLQLIDINGDHLQDVVQVVAGQLRYRLYLGWGKWSPWTTLSVQGLTNTMLPQIQWGDINGDALSDIVVFQGNSIRYFLNKSGTTFAAGQLLQSQNIPDSTTHSIRFADINGNGTRDIVWINASGQVTYLELFPQRLNLLTTIHNGIGKWIEITYGSSVWQQMRDQDAGKPWKSLLPTPYLVVRRLKTWATGPNGTQLSLQEQDVSYHQGYYDGQEKQFRGFQEVVSTHFGDSSIETKVVSYRFDVGEQDVYRKGKMLAQTTANDQGKVYQTLRARYSLCNVEGTQATQSLERPVKYYCQASQETVLQEGLPSSRWKTTLTEYTYDGYGNVTLTAMKGDKDTVGDEKYIATEYIPPSKAWQLRKLQRRQVYASPASSKRTEEKFYYDDPPFQGMSYGMLTRGNLSRVTARVYSDKDTIVERNRSKYDRYGNIVEQRDANGNRRTFTWDSEYGRFAVQENVHLKALTLSMQAKWDLNLSQIVESQDWNGNVTRYQYDNFTRIQAIAKPGDSLDKPTSVFSYILRSPLSQIVSQQRSQKGGSLDIKSINCFDGMGQKRSVLKQVRDGLFQVQEHIDYNNSGGKKTLWNPYTQTTESCNVAAPQSTPKVQVFFDAMARSIRQIQQDQSKTQTQYEPFKTIAFDEEDNRQGSPHFNTPTTTVTDGLGHVLKVITMDRPGHTITQIFTWDDVNTLTQKKTVGVPQLIKYVDPLGNIKEHTVDLLGRVLEVKDPNTGTISYAYDDQGNLLRRTDARPKTTLYSYDQANRLRTIMEKSKPETTITFAYDNPPKAFPQATNLKGKLASIQYPVGQEFFTYDNRSRLTQYRKDLLGHPFLFVMSYDNIDRIIQKTYPDQRTLSFQYDGMSRINQVSDLLPSITYATNGNLQSWTAGNGIVTQLTYDNRLRPKTHQVDNGNLLNFAYKYDANGNFLEIQDSGVAKKYTYDALYRLTKAELGGAETLTYSYNDVGNILNKSSSLGAQSPAHVGSYTYDKKQPYAVTQAGDNKLAYDKAGNAQNHKGMSHTWDFLGRRTETQQAKKTIGRYWYGADRIRQIKYENELHTLYLTPDYEIRDGFSTIYVRVGNQRVASSKSTKGIAVLYDDLAPATGEEKLTAKPDGKMTAGDALLYWHVQQGNRQAPLKERPIQVSLSDDMMAHRLNQLLDDNKETQRYYHNDHIGSTRKVTDASKQVIAETNYYPYGAMFAQKGNIVFGYMNTEKDAATSLNYAKSRYLDTSLGRWVSADAKFEKLGKTSDEFNVFWYGSNNPVRYIDTSGTNTKDKQRSCNPKRKPPQRKSPTLSPLSKSNRMNPQTPEQYNQKRKDEEMKLVKAFADPMVFVIKLTPAGKYILAAEVTKDIAVGDYEQALFGVVGLVVGEKMGRMIKNLKNTPDIVMFESFNFMVSEGIDKMKDNVTERSPKESSGGSNPSASNEQKKQ